MHTNQITLTIRARAFTHEGVRANKVRFCPSTGQILVWDSIAGHYTACHSLSKHAVDRVLKMALSRIA